MSLAYAIWYAATMVGLFVIVIVLSVFLIRRQLADRRKRIAAQRGVARRSLRLDHFSETTSPRLQRVRVPIGTIEPHSTRTLRVVGRDER